MTPHRICRPLLVLAVAASVLGAGTALAAPKAPKLGPNLAPNPSFEQGNDATIVDGNYNPVPPTGWNHQGATVLFDYKTSSGRTGKKSVFISGSLGGGKQLCDASSGTDTCAPNAAYPVTSQVDGGTRGTYSMRPFWLTDKPIPTVAGKTYRFSVYSQLPSLNPNAGVPGEGAATQIKWVDAAGKAIEFVEGAKLVKTPGKRSLGFKLITADLKAPAGAAGAVLMLGHTEYTHTGAQVAFDDVSFQQVG